MLHEVLAHEHNALLCTPDDTSQWVQALVRLRDDIALGQRLADQAYREFMESHTWQARTIKLFGITHEVIPPKNDRGDKWNFVP